MPKEKGVTTWLVAVAAAFVAIAIFLAASRARPASLTALGLEQLNAQVHVAIGAFNSQFAFSLILFGVYLLLLAWLIYRSGYIPKWVAIALAIAGAGWSIKESGPYVLPGTDLGFLFVATFGELALLAWLLGWGIRLREPIPNQPSS
jgi:Domain of unknown function (DUF4386)